MLNTKSIKQFSIEGIVIVVSILLAFSIEAWWQDRQDTTDEIILLQAMRQDLVENSNRIERQIEVVELAINQLIAFLENSYEEFLITNPTPVFGDVIRPMSRTFTTSGTAGGFIPAATNSGKFAQIDSPVIRSGIARIDSRQLNLDTIAEDIRGLTDQILIELGKHPEALRPTWSVLQDWNLPLSDDQYNSLKSSELLLALTRAKLNRYTGYFGNLRLTNEVLKDVATLIEDELANYRES